MKFNGYKSFLHGEEHEIDLSPYVTVFIGKNNCGKSSCIDAIETALMHNRFLVTKNLYQEIAINFKINMHIFYQINMYKFRAILLRHGRNFAVDKISL